jgi:undecaprenyl-diphosphatase
MALGLRRDEAARFGFLLGVPAILAAAVKEGLPLVRHGLPPGEGTIFAVGIATSAVVGYLAVRLFLRYLTRHSLSVFAWYRLALAASVVIWWVAR